LAGETRGLTAQPTGLASGPGTELPSQSGPGHDPRRRRVSPGSWPGSMDLGLFVGAPSAVSPIAGWAFGTHAWLTGTCRIAQADHVRRPCGSRTADRTTGDQEGHRVAAAPPGCEWTVSVALHSQTFLLGVRLSCAGPERNHRPLARGSRSGACVRVRNASDVAGVLCYVGGRVRLTLRPAVGLPSTSETGPDGAPRPGPGYDPGGSPDPGS
jgi:hypothetical protein